MQPTTADVAAVLAHYPPDSQPTSVTPLGSAGGMSGAIFWRIVSPRGVLGLRRWPIEHPAPDRLRFIHTVLRHAATHGCGLVPLPVTTASGESFVLHAGHLWELGPWMPGAADYESAPSGAKLRAAMRALAQFHAAVASFALSAVPVYRTVAAGSPEVSNAVQRHLTLIEELQPNSLNSLSRGISDETWPELAPHAREFIRCVPNAIPHARALLEVLKSVALPLQPCIKDIWHDHVLFTGSEVTGLIDFGAVDIDTPATDVARLLSSLASVTALSFGEGQGEGSTPLTTTSEVWSHGLAAYNTVCPLSENEAAAANALATSGAILAGCNWIRWIYADGRQFENQQRIIERFKRIVTAVSTV